jgi:uncharacterized protein YecT (DUF1311 family)
MRTIVAAAVALTLTSSVTAAPSFDCARARSNTEQMICGEPAGEPSLQWFDRQLARLYKLVLKQAHGQAREQLVAEQGRFLVARDACSVDYECVLKAYEVRLAALAPRLNVFEPYAKYGRQKFGNGRIWLMRFGFDAAVMIYTVGGGDHLCAFQADSAQLGGKGVIRWRGQSAEACSIDIVPDGDDMRVETRNCQEYCGARAAMDGLFVREP